jgi:hypothetical protein
MLQNKRDCWTTKQYNEIIKETGKHLWRFIQKNSSVSSPEDIYTELTKVSKKNLHTLSFIYFMLSDEVKVFVEETAPSILEHLSKTSLKEYRTLRGNVKGKINWSKTINARYAAGGDTSLYVCSQRSSMFDLPENRLLLYMLRKILYIASSLTNMDFNEKVINNKNQQLKTSKKWVDVVMDLGIKTNKLLQNPYIRKIGEMHELTNKIIIQAERARGQMYTQLAQTAKTYQMMINSPVIYLNRVLKDNILHPINKDTLYEIAVLFKLLDIIRENGWVEKQIGLIGGGSSVISRFKLNQTVIQVYYQGIPKDFTLESKYGPLMSTYGLSDKLRRPDIVLEVKNGDKKYYYIIEVKRSDKRTYIVDGAYKLFGYLKDFENVKSNNVNLSGILVCWSNITDVEPIGDNEIYLSSWQNSGKTFDFIIKSVMKL